MAIAIGWSGRSATATSQTDYQSHSLTSNAP
jgi:hypothetical protein